MSRWASGLSLVCLCLVGCGGGDDYEAPKFDPSEIGASAVAQYDTDGDQQLSKAELKACPGIHDSMDKYDQNGDGKVSAEEVQARIEAFMNQGIGRMEQSCMVYSGRQPLPGATVVIEPEDFMKEVIVGAEGVSDRKGGVNLATADGQYGVQIGVYKVRITHPEKEIKPKFNTETTLGLEVDPTTAHVPTPTYNVAR